MKSSMLNWLRLSVFLLAIIGAFAFTQPTDPDQPKYGKVGNTWVNLTGQMPGGGIYDCDEEVPVACTRSGEGDHFPIVDHGQLIYTP